MKKIFIVCALIISATAFSQPQKGDFFISGNFSVINNKAGRFNDGNETYHDTRSYFSLMAEAAYFVNDRVSIGIFDRQQYTKRINDNDDQYNDNINSVGAAARYYIPIKKGGIFFEEFAGINFGKSEGLGETDIISGFFAGISPAVYYYITERIALEAEFGSIQYDRRKYKAEGTDIYMTESTFMFQFSPWSLSLGMGFNF